MKLEFCPKLAGLFGAQLAGVDAGHKVTLDFASETHGAVPSVYALSYMRLDDLIETGGDLDPAIGQGMKDLGLDACGAVFAGKSESHGVVD